MVFAADVLTGHSRESTGGSVPLNVSLSRVSEPGCTKAGPPLSGMQPSLIHLCFPAATSQKVCCEKRSIDRKTNDKFSPLCQFDKRVLKLLFPCLLSTLQ